MPMQRTTPKYPDFFWRKVPSYRLRLRFKVKGIWNIVSSSKIYLISKDMLLRQPPPYDYDIEDCKAIPLDEAEKLYAGLEK